MGIFDFKSNKKRTPAPAPATIATDSVPDNQRQVLNELVLESINEGVLIVDQRGNIQLANPAACKLIGRDADELLNVNHESVITLLDKTGNEISTGRSPINLALKQKEYGETRNLDLVAGDSGKTTPVSIITTATPGNNPNIIVTFRDIDRELREEQERSEFISTASHEMRTPVTTIEGYLGLALNPNTATLDDRAKNYLEKAHEASQHLGKLFQDLLDTTKLDDGKIQPEMRPVEIVELVRKIAEDQVPKITEKGLGYQFGSGTIDQQLGGGHHIDQLIYSVVDETFLREIINNLIENAVKYTPSGWVTVNVKADNYNVQIIVQDTGIGIAREELSHVFQKFYRVDNRDTREIGGTGLGLYLVKQRVEAMNGRIWAESELGKGSRFIVLLPRISEEVYNQQKFLIENQESQGIMR